MEEGRRERRSAGGGSASMQPPRARDLVLLFPSGWAVLGNQRLGATLGGLGKLGERMGRGERERRDKDRLGGVCLWTARANEKPGKEH